MRRFLISVVNLILVALPAFYQVIDTQSEIIYEKYTFDEIVKYSEERARGIAQGFFNLDYYLQSREAKRVLEDPGIQEVIKSYEDSTNVKMISTSYINLPANDFWTKGARNSAIRNFEELKSGSSKYLANEVKFGPDDTGYGVNVELTPDAELEQKAG